MSSNTVRPYSFAYFHMHIFTFACFYSDAILFLVMVSCYVTPQRLNVAVQQRRTSPTDRRRARVWGGGIIRVYSYVDSDPNAGVIFVRSCLLHDYTMLTYRYDALILSCTKKHRLLAGNCIHNSHFAEDVSRQKESKIYFPTATR